MIHFFDQLVSYITLPERFTHPFSYTPHPLCVLAIEEVKVYISTKKEWLEELTLGRMFGILVVQIQEEEPPSIGYLAAFSGSLAGKSLHPYFVPPVYDLLQPRGFSKIGEEQISAINVHINGLEINPHYLHLEERLDRETEQARLVLIQAREGLKTVKREREFHRQLSPVLSEEEQNALIRESQYQKAEFKRSGRGWEERINTLKEEVTTFETEIEKLKNERKQYSTALQQKLFERFRMPNAKRKIKDLCTIFEQTIHKISPAGVGECALPKLLQYAYLHRLKPLITTKFWWGNPPKTEVRHHDYYYLSCKGECEPILQHMLQGLRVGGNLLSSHTHRKERLKIVFEGEWLAVINKPFGMLSVPGKKEKTDSVYHRVKVKYPEATGPMTIHRLDTAVSGLLLVAKTKEVHQHLQKQFINRSIKRRYVALLDRNGLNRQFEEAGTINLPLCLDPLDRPRQMVSGEYNKPVVTKYRILDNSDKYIHIAFYPLTGRAHQLRVHTAHHQGSNCPILGDGLYGEKVDRLYPHAKYIEFRRPAYDDIIRIQKEAEFQEQFLLV